jgi:hypothetical protein
MEYRGNQTMKLVATVEARPDMTIMTSPCSNNKDTTTLDHHIMQHQVQWQHQHHHHQQQSYHRLWVAADSTESTPTWSNKTTSTKQHLSFSPHGEGSGTRPSPKRISKTTRKHQQQQQQQHASSLDQRTQASPTSMVPVDHQKIIKRAVKLLKTKSVPVREENFAIFMIHGFFSNDLSFPGIPSHICVFTAWPVCIL